MADHTRLLALLKSTPGLETIYPKLDQLTTYTQTLFNQFPYNQFATPNLLGSFEIVGAPSREWTPAFVGDHAPTGGTGPSDLLVAYRFADPERAQEFVDLVGKGQGLAPDADIRAVGADLGVGGADHWCPGLAKAAMFRDRAAANLTINASALAEHNLFGQRVNVVIIDGGLDQTAIPTANWGGGLNWAGGAGGTVPVGTAQRTSHGMMIARSILNLAPRARLYDVPLLPDRIASIPNFIGLSTAVAAYQTLLGRIQVLQADPNFSGPWILVNAWAIYDRATELPPGDYTENKAFATSTTAQDHVFIQQVKAANARKFDVIFAAGNCGEFCPKIRCGGRDRGSGNSIWGANALGETITLGAVRSDEKWIGYSSQGPAPGINHLAANKPDLCAPSNFHEVRDAHLENSGTSASCALTAGVVAALRSAPTCNQTAVPPAAMLAALIAGARKPQGSSWNARLGNGILDAAGAIGHLPI